MALQSHIESLISTMTRAEKRYFKVNASKNGDAANKQFIKLFDAIDKGKELPIGKGENRSVTNAYLYNSVLDCLVSFHARNSDSAQIDRLIQQGDALRKRGLGQQAVSLFLKAENLAQQHQDFVRLQLVYWHLRAILATNTKLGSMELTMEYVLEQNLRTAKEIELLARLRFIQYQFQQTISKAANITDDMIGELNAAIESQAMKDVKDDSGFFAQLTAFNIRSQYYSIVHDHENGLLMSRKVFELCHQQKDILKERGRLMIGSANNYMMRCLRAGQFEEIKRVLDLLEKEQPRDRATELILTETYLSNLLNYDINTKKNEHDQVLKLVETRLEGVSESMNQAFLMFIYTLCSAYAFYGGDHRKALKWINLFLNHENRNSLEKSLDVAEDYRLIIYYEQGKLDLLDNILNNPDTKNASGDFPLVRTAIRSFLRKELNHGEEHVKNASDLLAELNQLKSEQKEPQAFEFFRFDEWARSKTANL
ncbi:MAG: hypothetical protein H6602_01695 [Flavobacteriales bacterium]|nr:hypothetical protein [Flavobacteriales bacterium]